MFTLYVPRCFVHVTQRASFRDRIHHYPRHTITCIEHVYLHTYESAYPYIYPHAYLHACINITAFNNSAKSRGSRFIDRGVTRGLPVSMTGTRTRGARIPASFTTMDAMPLTAEVRLFHVLLVSWINWVNWLSVCFVSVFEYFRYFWYVSACILYFEVWLLLRVPARTDVCIFSLTYVHGN